MQNIVTWHNITIYHTCVLHGMIHVLCAFVQIRSHVIDAKDTPALIKIFKDLVLKSYGEKSPDGKRFIKTKELTEAFSQTEAYSEIFMELATNDKVASEFVKGITPPGLEQYTQDKPALKPVE